MKIYIAPVQGHTDAAWRHFHRKHYGEGHKYFTPFMRIEHGAVREKDLRDFMNPMNDGLDLEPQVIFADMEELQVLLTTLHKAGAKAVNLNIGCPFPLQTRKGRGAGFIANISEAEKMPELLATYPDIKFSVKMRLGMESPEEWKGIMPYLNLCQLDRIYVHPRTARQQYGGELNYAGFAEILQESKNPVAFNGDIKTPEDIKVVAERFPDTDGIMVARGILGRPSLAAEYAGGEWTRERRIEKMKEFHRDLLTHYTETLFGDSQILSKIKPFWEYAEEEIGRKAWKALKKTNSLPKYCSYVSSID